MRLKLDLMHLYLPISIILIILSFFYKGQSTLQLQLTIAAVLIYFIFSFIHHLIDKSLTFETIFEYILIASLVLIILTGTVV